MSKACLSQSARVRRLPNFIDNSYPHSIHPSQPKRKNPLQSISSKSKKPKKSKAVNLSLRVITPPIVISNEKGFTTEFIQPPSVQTLFTWKFKDQHQWHPFESELSSRIDQCFITELKEVAYYTNGHHYILYFPEWKQVNVASGTTREVARYERELDQQMPKPLTLVDSSRVKQLLNILSSSYPPYWTHDQIQQGMTSPFLVECVQKDPQYSIVNQLMASDIKSVESIVKVYKVINPVQYFRYTHWCDLLKLKQQVEEQYVFHGTKECTTESIIKHGFKYRFNGRHNYGRGTYFAANARYSLDPLFAVPNSQGNQFLFISRYCIGTPVLGTSNLFPSTDESYHTAVDNLSTPKIFVSFHDDQSYPEFMVVVKM